MKNYILIHALGNTADEYWYPWLKAQISNLGFKCETPTMPSLDKTSYSSWKEIMKKYKHLLNEETVVIGHSTGSIFLAHYIIENKIKINKFIGVVSFNEKNTDSQHPDWDKINETFFIKNLKDLILYTKERVCYYSPTDIYDFKLLDKFATTIDAKKIIIKDAGHFTATTGYGERFEEILKEI